MASVKNFNKKQQTGLDYICVCCCTVRFKKSVQELTKELEKSIRKQGLGHCLSVATEKFKFDGKFWIHHNCAALLKKGKMPNICFYNNLENKDIPEVFKQATLVEKLAIKKKIPFIKIRELPSSRMKFMKDRIINVAISDSDVLKSALTLPRGGDKLATVNVAVKRQLKSRNCYKGPELVRPKVINEMLSILKEKKHKSYIDFPIQFLDESSKYKFITLPMVGEEETDERLMTLTQAFDNLIPPLLDSLKVRLGTITPQDPYSFLNALLDHCKNDYQYQDNDFTIEQMRNDISSEIFKDENRDLHHVLYFGSDLLEPGDWKDLVMQIDEDTLPCDLPFVQLASNYLKRKFYLIPVNQPNTESEKTLEKTDLEKKLLKVIPNEETEGPPFLMLYFPQGDFGPQSYFQSIFLDLENIPTSSTKFAWMSYDEEKLIDQLAATKKPDNYDDLDDEEESEDESNNLSSNTKTKGKIPQDKIGKKTRKNTGNAYNAVTMITPIDPTAKVIVNRTGKTIKTKVSNKDPIYQIAPGEGKIPSDWLRDKDFDIDAFPDLHVTGKNGLDESRC